MWYSTGTVSVTSGGTTVNGSGTNFIANVRVGDGITIQGSTSLHEVVAIASPTQLTIRPAYPGTSGSGRQFACAPLLGYDKDLSDAFNQLRLQFGDKLSALQPWAYAATANQALIELGFSSVGRSVATGNAEQGRAALGLGTSATRDITISKSDTTSGRLMRVGDGGLLNVGTGHEPTYATLAETPSGMWVTRDGLLHAQGHNTIHKPTLLVKTLDTRGFVLYSQAAGPGDYNRLWFASFYSELEGQLTAAEIYHTDNTTVDSNGFIKDASPIIKLHADRIETETEASFERIDTGHYQLSNTNGLRLGDGWYIETPHDRNKVPYFNVEWEQDVEPPAEAGILDEPADVTLTIRCYERVWNPETGLHENGDPVDIPDGRWIDLRMNEVREPDEEVEESAPELPQQPSEPSEPAIPDVVTMAQAKLALLYADLYEPVEAYIEGLPEPHKTAALIEWNHRQTLNRSHPLVEQVATGLGLTEQQLDDLFLDAAGR